MKSLLLSKKLLLAPVFFILISFASLTLASNTAFAASSCPNAVTVMKVSMGGQPYTALVYNGQACPINAMNSTPCWTNGYLPWSQNYNYRVYNLLYSTYNSQLGYYECTYQIGNSEVTMMLKNQN